MYLYIVGRPHCGSTILDIVLGSSRSIESVGELASSIHFGERAYCGCGETIEACHFWNRVKTTVVEKGGLDWETTSNAIAEQAHLRHFLATLFQPRSLLEKSVVARSVPLIEEAVAHLSGKPHMLDSTKEATRGLLLLKTHPAARIIHLVRDPRRAVASHYWRFRKGNGYFHFLRRKYHAPKMLVPFMIMAATAWFVGNFLCQIDRWVGGDRVMRIRYEDLSSRPTAILTEIGRWLDLSMDDVIARIERREPLEVGHNIGGNHIRLEKTVIFEAKEDGTYDMPAWLSILTVSICWPLMLAYGYPLTRVHRVASS